MIKCSRKRLIDAPKLDRALKPTVFWLTKGELPELMRYHLSSLVLFPGLFRARQLQPSLPAISHPQSRSKPLQISRSYYHELITQSHNEKKTIYALSTPPGRAGVAVIRISGPNALDVYRSVVITSSGTHPEHKMRAVVPTPWRMERCSILDPKTHETLDDGLAVFFKGMPHRSHSLGCPFPILCPFYFHRAKIIHIGGCP
jgi:GTP-binding protein TrmE N-terminus